jgi:hypothetical protein
MPDMPEVKANGRHVRNFPERCMLKMKGDKIMGVMVTPAIPGSPQGGPMGFYLQTAGKLSHGGGPNFIHTTESLLTKIDLDEWDEYTAPDFNFMVAGGPTMNKPAFMGLMRSLKASFPDMSFQPLLGLKDGSEADTVEVIVNCSGTHTGAGFALPDMPEVKANGKKVRNYPERCVFKFNSEGKVVNIMVAPAIPGSPPGGPMGWYLQISGKLVV